MSDMRISNATGMHPVILIAAIAVILTCLFAIGVMTGLISSPLTRTAPTDQLATATRQPVPGVASGLTREDLRDQRPAVQVPASEPRPRVVEKPSAARTPERERPPVGRTSDAGATGTVAGRTAAPAPAPARVAAACTNCGAVSSVRAVTQQGEAGMIGPAAGTLIGGVAGSQIGSGSGKTIATVIGAGAGAAIGTEVERRSKSTTSYVVGVRMNDGTSRSFTYPNEPGVAVGDRVRVVDGRLLRD
ncbi:MAG TPA: glycine zipper 2TM domain-containing protein [Burkholderiales bacterium]|nr:glycine zipper 2TM domain-containing protein [Burkholderiales bacterium]